MLGIGTQELITIMLLALIIFGPEKLPELSAQIGRAIRNFRRMSQDASEEFTRVANLDAAPVMDDYAQVYNPKSEWARLYQRPNDEGISITSDPPLSKVPAAFYRDDVLPERSASDITWGTKPTNSGLPHGDVATPGYSVSGDQHEHWSQSCGRSLPSGSARVAPEEDQCCGHAEDKRMGESHSPKERRRYGTYKRTRREASKGYNSGPGKEQKDANQ